MIADYIFPDEDQTRYMVHDCQSSSIELRATHQLNWFADQIRSAKGFIPFYNGDNRDEDGWYRFQLSFTLKNGHLKPNNIEFFAENPSSAEDYLDIYTLELYNPNMFEVMKSVRSRWNGGDLDDILDKIKEELEDW